MAYAKIPLDNTGEEKEQSIQAIALTGYNTSEKRFKAVKVNNSGQLESTAVISGDVDVNIDEINAELKVDSGHDLYKGVNVVGNDTWTITFDEIVGLSLKDVQGVENKTTGEVYKTAGATVDDTSIALDSVNNDGKTKPQAGDVLELIYRGVSRFDDKAKDVTLTNASQKTQIVDSAGDVIGSSANALNINIASSDVTIGGDAEQTPDLVAATKIVQNGGIANTTVPVAVSNGDAVATWMNEFGQQVLYGSNLSSNAMDANIINQALLNTINVTLLSAVTATGASVATDVSNFNKLTFHIIASSVTTGGTMKIQHSIDGTNYVDVAEETISANGVKEVAVSDKKYRYVRANLTARTDGTYSVLLFGGN